MAREERPPPPGKMVGPDGAIGVRASSTVVGLHFASIGAATLGFGGSAPIAGKVQLEGIIFMAGSSAPAEDPHRFQMALASDVPASAADLDAAEQMFPRISQLVATRNFIILDLGSLSFWLPVTTVLAMNGRRLVGGFYNGHAANAMDGYVGFVMHRVYGGASSGDPAFLSGEEVEER